MSNITYNDIVDAYEKVNNIPAFPVALEVSPEVHNKLKSANLLASDIMGDFYAGLPVYINYHLYGDQCRYRYNK